MTSESDVSVCDKSFNYNDISDDSDASMKLVIESPQSKKKQKAIINQEDKDIIAEYESTLEKKLEDSAAKSNLSLNNVKNILKHVVTNEHVLAMVRQAENPSEELILEYEPKLTRAKAKELLSSSPMAPISSWISPNTSTSETHALISADFTEDSSGDEYIPGEDDSEDERDSTQHSECDHLSQPATPQAIECATQTNWSCDGVFKLPCTKNQEDEEPNIALRTRSKFCLSNTPLEVIEEAFIPPDITTDMYDMDCDHDIDWMHFLKQFFRPLDEVTKTFEDEDHDPEYNVLADEEIDKIDLEELRADRGVKVTRKELNELIDELFNEENDMDEPLFEVLNNKSKEPDPQYTIMNNSDIIEAQGTQPIIQTTVQPLPVEIVIIDENMILNDQKLLLEQQMRQHVQMLTQNFLLTYKHPEYHSMSVTFKEYLLNLKHCPGTRQQSYFLACNLEPALNLIQFWENKLDCDMDDECIEYNMEVVKTICELKQAKSSGIEYISTFPKLILKTIMYSSVFIYPALLPRVILKPKSVLSNALNAFSSSQNSLIALGLEQFIPNLQMDSNHVNSKGEVILKNVCYYIEKYILPTQNYIKIYKHVVENKPKTDGNPINYYFQHNKAPTTVHYVVPLFDFKILAPKDRHPEQLPYQWKEYLYQNMHPNDNLSLSYNLSPTIYRNFEKQRKIYPKLKVLKQKPNNLTVVKKSNRKLIFNANNIDVGNKLKPLVTSTPLRLYSNKNLNLSTSGKTIKISDALLNIKFNSSIFEKLNKKTNVLNKQSDINIKGINKILIKTPTTQFKKSLAQNLDMLPSMPMIGTPMRNSPEHEINYDFKTTPESDEILIIDDKNMDTDDNCDLQKDNLDDINALMVASSTIKNLGKKRTTSSEKKKAKLCRELNATLRMLSPEDAEAMAEKTNRFVQAFYDKVQEQLELHEYHKFMEALNDFDEKRNTVTELYKKVTEAIGPKHADLNEEFLTFFNTLQAKKIGKLVPHLMLNNMALFLRKLEMYFKDQPSQVRKIYRCLSELIGSKDLTSREVKNTILPLLKGNSLLTDWFLQIFPSEKPPNKLLNGAWETVEVGKDTTLKSQDIFETIIVPEVEDPYGGTTCICSCHLVEEIAFKTRSRHCIPCGTKFLQGRVFVQTGKGLRLAKISFDDNNIDHLARLACRTKVKSPSKQISPGKDSQDENRLSSDDEPEKKRLLLKTPKKRKPKKKISEAIVEIPHVAIIEPAVHAIIPVDCVKDIEAVKKVGECCSDHNTENTSDSSINEQKQAVEETLEWDCNTSIESIELRLSPDHPSAESESEFCEETSQDNINSDSDASGGDSETNSPNSPIPSELVEQQWTRDEDKIILETFQRKEDKEDAFEYIASVLNNRSVQQINERFEMLINLIKQMASSS